MLDALAVELHQEFLDLPGAARSLLVQRDADHAVGCGHGLAGQAGVRALDVEVADLAEVEQPFVKRCPVAHPTAVDVVRQVVDERQAVAHRMAVDAVDKIEIDVVDRAAILEAVDQVQRRAANALDGRQAQLHRPGRDVDGLGAQCQCPLVGLVRILDPERQPAGRRAMLGGKVSGDAVRLAVDDEIDAALAVEHDILGPMAGHQREAHAFEQRLEQLRSGRCELDELEAHQPHRVVEQIGHDHAPVGVDRRGVCRPWAAVSTAAPAARKIGRALWLLGARA